MKIVLATSLLACCAAFAQRPSDPALMVPQTAPELDYLAVANPLPVPEGMDNARADGKRIVVPAANPKLPQRCVKTNQEVTPAEIKKRKLYWYPPLIAVTILLSVLIFLILYLVLRKKVEVDIPLSKAGRKIVLKNGAITWGLVLGGIFVAEALSVIVQIASCRYLGRRALRCAPLHHHFQLTGWSEEKIVTRFWIAAIMCAVAGLAMVKGGTAEKIDRAAHENLAVRDAGHISIASAPENEPLR